MLAASTARWLMRRSFAAAVALLLPMSALAVDQAHRVCIRAAAANYYQRTDPVTYQGFVDLIEAVLGVENGCGVVSTNTNTSRDYGCMQINSIHVPLLRSYGISLEALVRNDCQNIVVGTWILHREITASRDLWSGVGNYNSHTPKHNLAYQRKVWYSLQRVWASRMAGR